MAFDGITVAALVAELKETLEGGRIYKIAQPEKDELLLTVKNNGSQYRLLMSANPSLPLLYLTDENKKSPLNAPNFCMLLRKHIQNARILDIAQPGLERAVHIRLEHLNELGDLCEKILTMELMGKYSNIIFRDDEKIIDSMKHVSTAVSSVREVLPQRPYFIPGTEEKINLPEVCGEEIRREFEKLLAEKSVAASKFIYKNFTGISPVMSEEICFRAGVDGDKPTLSLEEDERRRIEEEVLRLKCGVERKEFSPNIVYENGVPEEFGVFLYSIFKESEVKEFQSISRLLKVYYEEKVKY